MFSLLSNFLGQKICFRDVELALVTVICYNLFKVWNHGLLFIIFPSYTNSFLGYKGIQ